jgi:hypothetical protein
MPIGLYSIANEREFEITKRLLWHTFAIVFGNLLRRERKLKSRI